MVCCQQLGAALVKNFHQKRRDPVGCCLELTLPILFIVGCIGLWQAFGVGDEARYDFMVLANESTAARPNNGTLIERVCASAAGGGPRGLANCSDVGFNVTCLTAAHGSPLLEGFCYDSALNPRGVAAAFAYQYVEKPAVAPDFDTLVVAQLFQKITTSGVRRRDWRTPEMSLFCSGYLYFAPDTPATAGLVAAMNASAALFDFVYGGTFASEEAAGRHVARVETENTNWAIIVVNSLSATDFDVVLRLNHTALPMAEELVDPFFSGGANAEPDGNNLYLSSGFATLQAMVQRHYVADVLGLAASVAADPPVPVFAPMGYPAYDANNFLLFAGALAPLIVVLAFLYPVSQLTKRIVLEKEQKLREVMFIMGLTHRDFYLSWFITYAAQYLLSSAVMTALVKATFLVKANAAVVFFTFLLFMLSTISLSGLLAACFSKSRIAALVAPVVYFGLACPLFAIQSASASAKRGLLLLSPTAFAQGVQLLFDHEIGGGLGSAEVVYFRDDPNMLAVLFMLAVDTVLYALAMLYIDAVLPGDWGTPHHPLFCVIEPARWLAARLCGGGDKARDGEGGEGELPDGRSPDGVFEPVGPAHGYSDYVVRMAGLRKQFQRGSETFTAVNNFYWGLRENEISVLLGHNGAGKSTLINLCTALLPPDAGDCSVYGHSVRRDVEAARREIGYCGQQNVLWAELTCAEHLRFYAALKGLGGAEREAAVTAMLRAVDLEAKRDYAAGALSGGQKRRLCVAIAYVGGSRLIFLDEATAGCDSKSRRFIWDLVRKMAPGRATLLCTHFMDEADELGGASVAIMSRGALQCAGSSMFLKARLGVGYSLVLNVQPDASPAAAAAHVARLVPDAEALPGGAGEAAFRLPMHAVGAFPALLEVLEERGKELGVRGFQLTATTLEEIFLQLAHGNHAAVAAAAGAAAAGGSKTKRRASAADEQRLLAPPPPTAPGAASAAADDGGKQRRAGSAGAARRRVSNDHGGYSDPDRAAAAVVAADGSPLSPPSSASGVAVEMAAVADADAHAPTRQPPREAAGIWDVRLETDEGRIVRAQFAAMLRKRLANSLRDRRTQCLQIVCPVVCILLAMLLTLIQIITTPKLRLDSAAYGEQTEIALAGCADLFAAPRPFAAPADRVRFVDAPAGDALELSAWLIDTAKQHGAAARYGAVACSDGALGAAVQAAGANATALLYNLTTWHEVPIAARNYMAALLTRELGAGAVPRIALATHAMPVTDREAAFSDSIKSIMIGIIIMIPFTFIPSTFTSWVVKERECKARHLQSVSGLRFSVYWLSNLVFDTASFLCTMVLTLIVFAIFGRSEYVGSGENFAATLVLLLLYGLSGIAVSYAVSFLFEEHATAQNAVLLVNFITGFLLVLVVFILDIVDSTKDAAAVLRWIFRVVPSYCLGEGIINLAVIELQRSFGGGKSPFSLDVVGYDLLYMGCIFPTFLLLTLAIDHPGRRLRTQRLLHRKDAPPEIAADEDEAVRAEREAVSDPAAHGRASDLVRVVNLRKVYPNGKVAVRNISFGVRPGEIFGFLGSNGCGKTTTIAMCCGELVPTSGHAEIAGHDIVEDTLGALRNIGYCPQFDAILELLTVREHLDMYAAVRGVAAAERARVVASVASLCQLTTYMEARAGELSGGNKRKLSVAIALIGGPTTLWLDEPSAGLDPEARRGLWTALQAVSTRCGVVMTTHHLEEVQALAQRVLIMVDGTARCVGTLDELARKFGDGLELAVLVADAARCVPRVEAFVAAAFAGAHVIERRGANLVFSVPFAATRMSAMFRVMQEAKEGRASGVPGADAADLGIVHYTVQQTSLEQVFLRVLSEANAADKDEEFTAGFDAAAAAEAAAAAVAAARAARGLSPQPKPKAGPVLMLAGTTESDADL